MEDASVGDWLEICPWVASQVGCGVPSFDWLLEFVIWCGCTLSPHAEPSQKLTYVYRKHSVST